MKNLKLKTIQESSVPGADVRLIRDIPASEDAFGPHLQLAESLQEIITCEEGGCAVGLEGTWGSGKSTVIQLLKRQLPDCVFVFDAWSHEGDPLRRVFIEQLIDFFISSKEVNRKLWNKKKEELAKRIRQNDTEVTPVLTPAGVIAAVVVLLTPVCLAIFADGLKSQPRLPNSFFFGATAVLAIPAVWAILVLTWELLKIVYCKAKGIESKFSFGSISLFLNKTVTKQTSQVEETPEPTSLEFESIFAELMREVYTKRSEPFVLVIDNLDRVPRDYALAIWSTLRVFLEKCASVEEEWSKKFWLIVPYDKPAVARLWSPKSSEEANTQIAPDLTADALATSFLQKTFQIRLQVPPLVLADWKDFLVSLLERAFPGGLTEVDCHALYRLYSIYCADRPPTPRSLKLYVNDLTSHYRRHSDGISVPHFALYTLMHYEGIDIGSALRKGEVPSPKYGKVLGDSKDKIARNIASIHFGRPDEVSQQLLLAGPIQDALSEARIEEFQSLSKQVGFWEVFENLLPALLEEWADESASVCNAGRTIHESKLEIPAFQDSRRDALKRFARNATTEAVWKRVNKDMARGLVGFLNLLNSPKDSLRILSQVIDSIPADESTLEEIESWEVPWGEAVAEILCAIYELDQDDTTKGEKIVLPAHPEAFVALATSLQKKSQTSCFWGRFTFAESGQPIVSFITPDSGSSWNVEFADVVDVALECEGLQWQEFVDGATQRLEASPSTSVPISEASALVGTLLQFKPEGKTQKRLAQLVASGMLHTRFERCCKKSQLTDAAKLLHLMLTVDPTVGQPAAVEESHTGYTRIQSFLANSSSEDNKQLLEEILLSVDRSFLENTIPAILAHGKQADSFVGELIWGLERKGNLSSKLSIESFLDHWRLIRRALAKTDEHALSAILKSIIGLPSFRKTCEKLKFATSETDLYRELIDAGGLEVTEFDQWLKRNIEQIQQEQWKEDLVSKCDVVDLCNHIAQLDDEHPKVGSSLADALSSVGTELVTQTLEVENPAAVRVALGILQKSQQAVVGKNLVEKLKEYDGKGNEFFEIFGELMASHFEELVGETGLVRHVFIKALQHSHEAGLTWTIHVLRQHRDILSRFPEDDKSAFVERVKEAVQANSDSKLLIELADVLGISVVESSDSEEPID